MLPIFNAAADYASIGLTRWRLRLGLERAGFVGREAFIDALGAIAIFILLGCTLITYIEFIRPRDGIALLDLSVFFADLKANPNNYWWLAFLLISTLLPTALHLFIASLAFFTFFPRWIYALLRRGIKEARKDGDGQFGLWAQLGLSAMIAIAIWVPWNIIWYSLSANHAWLLKKTIDFFAAYHAWLIS